LIAHRAKKEPLIWTTAEKELAYTLRQCQLDPYNESPWRYAMGIWKEQQQQQQQRTGDIREKVKAWYSVMESSIRKVLLDHDRIPETCADWTTARIDLLEMLGDDESLREAMELCQGLGEKYDTIRVLYWEHRKKGLEGKLRKDA